jgi:ankyrin repeat protein
MNYDTAIRTNNIQNVKNLIKNGIDMNRYSGDSLPITTAGVYNRIDIVKLLLKHNPKLNIRNSIKQTPLMIIAKWNTEEGSATIARLLLEKGAWLNAKDNKGKKAIDYAIKKNNIPLIEILHRWPLIKAQRLFKKNLARKRLVRRLKERKILEKALIIKTKLPLGVIKKIKRHV